MNSKHTFKAYWEGVVWEELEVNSKALDSTPYNIISTSKQNLGYWVNIPTCPGRTLVNPTHSASPWWLFSLEISRETD